MLQWKKFTHLAFLCWTFSNNRYVLSIIIIIIFPGNREEETCLSLLLLWTSLTRQLTKLRYKPIRKKNGQERTIQFWKLMNREKNTKWLKRRRKLHLKKVFIPIPKKGNAKEWSNYCTITLISHASKVMLKIFQARLQPVCEQWTSRCSSWVQKRQRNQRSNCQHLLDHWKINRVPKKICFIEYTKAFDCVDHKNLWKILQEMEIPGHLIWPPEKSVWGQEATVRTVHGTTDWFQIGKGVRQGCLLSPCLFNLYAENIMQNSKLDEVQAGIKIAGRNINNSDVQITPSLWQKWRRIKEPLDESERRE